MRERTIIHLNVADFAVAVERAMDRRLRQRPLIIAAEGAARATVYDMSEEAYQNGVRKKMALRRALRHCPDAAVLPLHPDRYERAMAKFLEYALAYSPRIEMTDYQGHLFIDATGTQKLFGPPPDIARRIRKAVRRHMDLDPIWSVAPNKLVAKVATRLVKPAGEYIVETGSEAAFLQPLPVGLIPGIELSDLKCLQQLNLTHIHQMTGLSLEQLDILFDQRSQTLYNAVRGIDLSPVLPVGQKRPSISAGHLFGDDTNDILLAESALYRLVEQTGADLRGKGLVTGRIKITLDYSDGRRAIRQAFVHPASANDFYLFSRAKSTLEQACKRRVRIRHLHLMCDRLTYAPAQQALLAPFEAEKKRTDRLMAAMDDIRSRFGSDALRVGRTFAVSPLSQRDL
ncbi:MAG: hypothetical protein Q8P24_08235 [Desulfobacterales bacterium]|nr:hypothetical protein [Desulfobacterales bacterium]